METNKQPARLGRPPKHEERNTRERILDAALTLFASQGFAGTSLRQIAQAVGIKDSAIYAHFESKDDVYRTLFEQIVTPASTVHEMLCSGDLFTVVRRGPEAVLRDVAQYNIEMWKEPRAGLFLCLVFREGGIGAGSGHSFLFPAIEQIKEKLGVLVQEWMKLGLIKDDFPPEHLVWEFLAPLAHIRILYWHAQATEAERELGRQRANLHIDYFLRTVLSTKQAE
jgi:AcrR family transcriptional regulator